MDGPASWLQFDEVPEGLFHRLVCVCAADSSESPLSRTPTTSRCSAILTLRDVDVYMMSCGSRIVLRFAATEADEMLHARNALVRTCALIVE